QGYARIKGKPGICLVTSGPGATNLVTGITDAMMDSTPIVCITGQVFASLLGTDAFQEADVMGITAPITKWSYQITNADEVPEIVAKAFYIAASGRPGPVLIDITKNAQVALMSKSFRYKKCDKILSYRPRLQPKQEQVELAAALINEAKKPYLFVGHGVLIAKAEEELKAFVEKTGIPAACTLLGLSAISVDHPQYVGMLGMHGNYSTNRLINEADLLIGLGMRFDDRVTGNVASFAPQAKVVHIDIDPSEINKIIQADAPVVGDAKAVLKALLPLLEKRDHSAWLAEFKELDKQEYEKVVKDDLYPQGGQIKMGEVIHRLSEKTAGKAAIVADVGQHQMEAARYYRFAQTDGYITSGGSGTMGFALPAAFGAKVAAPEREVVAIIGDGCFQMTLQELGTIWQSELPVKIIILNNNYLGMVRQWQQLFFDRRYSFVELKNPDFITIAKGFGIEGMRITERGELDGALDTLLESKKAFLLEVLVEKELNVFPMVPAGASVSDIRLE
ncbi:MAG TPA: biosynthetic-type acetolactate synthase large subunit, partial [Anseongella sp.]|nr:biosynthetic-type acetolactate synthase large subunit [Anseongella sp.]